MGTTKVEQKQIGRAAARQRRTDEVHTRKRDAAWYKVFDGLRDLTALGVIKWTKPTDAYRLRLLCVAAVADGSDFCKSTGSPFLAVSTENGTWDAVWKYVGRGAQPLFYAVQKSTEPRTRTRDHDEDYNKHEIDDDKIPF